jgi:hypothetical protein
MGCISEPMSQNTHTKTGKKKKSSSANSSLYLIKHVSKGNYRKTSTSQENVNAGDGKGLAM